MTLLHRIWSVIPCCYSLRGPVPEITRYLGLNRGEQVGECPLWYICDTFLSPVQPYGGTYTGWEYLEDRDVLRRGFLNCCGVTARGR